MEVQHAGVSRLFPKKENPDSFLWTRKEVYIILIMYNLNWYSKGVILQSHNYVVSTLWESS